MNKICTDVSQSKKLLELGIDVNTADMFYNEEQDETYPKDIVDTKYPMVIREEQKHYLEEYGIPAWSLSTLLNILPNDEVTTTTVTKGGWDSEAAKYLNLWFADYETEKHDNDFTLSADNPIDAAFEMLVKLKDNNFL